MKKLSARSSLTMKIVAGALTVGAIGCYPRAAVAAWSCKIDQLTRLAGNDLALTAVMPKQDPLGKVDYCSVSGTLRTHGGASKSSLPDGRVSFRLDLPDHWNGRFVMFGIGGFGGSLMPSANAVDLAEALPRGYAVAINDGGHASPPMHVDGSFAVQRDGSANPAAVADYFWRATHQSTIALKNLVHEFYRQPIKRAYFDGCSNGGRQGLIEAERFPDDYDGVVAGDPFLDLRLMLGDIKVQKAALASPGSRLEAKDLQTIDRLTLAQCTSPDGIIQDPRQCHVNVQSLLCVGGRHDGCLTQGQIGTVQAYLRDTVDVHGKRIYPGFAIGNLLQSGAGLFQFGDDRQIDPKNALAWSEGAGPIEYQFDLETLRYFVTHKNDMTLSDYPVGVDGVVRPEVLKDYDRATAPGSALDIGALRHFLATGRKIIFYHGFSDPAISPYSTIDFYRHLSDPGARLFMVPGMGHCQGGGVPDRFDTLGPLRDWVEDGHAPESLVAADAGGATRKTLLCPLPMQGHQVGGTVGGHGGTGHCVAAGKDVSGR